MLALDTSGFRDNQEKSMQCEDQTGNSNQPRFCEMREKTVPASGSLRIDAGTNGGVTVKGWNRSDVLVRSKVETWAPTMDEARSLTSSVAVHAAPGEVRADGPQTADHRGWSVSYEIFVPHLTSVTAHAHNGGMHVADVGGTLDVETVNGGLNLTRVTGDVKGVTVNGGVHVNLVGDHWDGRGLELSSTNGVVHMNVPRNYSAHLETSTVNGGVHNEFANAATTGRHGRTQSISTDIGSGGATLHVTTVNGGVSIGHNDGSDEM
jgi:hypothetical protein